MAAVLRNQALTTVLSALALSCRYSLPTIAAMVAEAERESKRACFLSTPSIYFSLNDKELQARSKVLDVSCTILSSEFDFIRFLGLICSFLFCPGHYVGVFLVRRDVGRASWFREI
jgi:hypothetical protein